jgi:hypothetical protein
VTATTGREAPYLVDDAPPEAVRASGIDPACVFVRGGLGAVRGGWRGRSFMMKRALTKAALGALLLVPGSAFAQNLDLHGGAFFPSANSNLFLYDSTVYSVSGSSAWIGATGGVQYSQRIGPNVEIGLGVDVYDKHIDSFYRNFTFSDGSNITQRLHLSEVPVGVTLRFVPTNRRAHIAPFVGIGGDLIFWTYEESGNFIDITNPGPVTADTLRSTGVTPGLHVEAGLRIPLNYDVAFIVQGKYLWAPKVDMGGDFATSPPNQIDLKGASALVGINFHF